MSPFTENPSLAIGSCGEVELIRRIRDWLGTANPPSPRGIGDDTAVLPHGRPNRQTLLTLDSLIHGRHFDDDVDPHAAGAKLLKRNLSDIAAMGGQPRHAVVGLAAGADVSLSWLQSFFEGLRDCALAHHCEINGGDIAETTTGQFFASLALTGEAERALLRKPATGAGGAGLWVTGTLGGSRARKHLDFTPRLAEGQWLAARPEVLALMDITDGPAKDFPAMVPDGFRLRLDASKIPLAEAAKSLAPKSGRTALDHALYDGEDYELAFLADQNLDPVAFTREWQAAFSLPLTRVGVLETCPESASDSPVHKVVFNDNAPLTEGGFQHFRP